MKLKQYKCRTHLIGNNKVVSWGRVHKTYTLSKSFEPDVNGYKSNDSEDRDIPFTTIIRLRM